MAGPTRKQIAEHFSTALWLKWQTQRRNPDYRKAVAQLLQDLRRDIAALVSQRQALQVRGKAWITSQIHDIDTLIVTDTELSTKLDAYRRVLLAYRQIKNHLRQFDAELTPTEHHALDNSEGGKYAEINHAVMNVIAPCLAQDILDQVPPWRVFAHSGPCGFPCLPWCHG
jgi:hypothetical protein